MQRSLGSAQIQRAGQRVASPPSAAVAWQRCRAVAARSSSSSSGRSAQLQRRFSSNTTTKQQRLLPIGGGSSSRHSRATAVSCRAADERPGTRGGSGSSSGGGLAAVKFNPVYLVIFGAYAGLLVFRNPYIYAVLTVATILPQNSNVTSLNNLILLFYESGLFQNFGEAVNCVRLVTWLSMGFMVASFALFK